MSIYVASKTCHAAMWKSFRDHAGYPIVSSWLDEAGPGETKDYVLLWDRCFKEASTADVLVMHVAQGDSIKGAWIELGAAMSHGVPVIAVVPDDVWGASVFRHGLTSRVESVSVAMSLAMRHHNDAQKKRAAEQTCEKRANDKIYVVSGVDFGIVPGDARLILALNQESSLGDINRLLDTVFAFKRGTLLTHSHHTARSEPMGKAKTAKKPANPNLENLGTPPSHDVDWVCIPDGGKDLRYTIVKGKLWFAVRAEGQRRLGCAVHAQQVELMNPTKMGFIRGTFVEVE